MCEARNTLPLTDVSSAKITMKVDMWVNVSLNAILHRMILLPKQIGYFVIISPI